MMVFAALILLALAGQPAAAEMPAAGSASAAEPAPNLNASAVTGAVRAEGQPLPAEMVVYLEAVEAPAPPSPAKRVRIAQKGAQFSPAFTVVAVGQTIEFVNDEDRAVEHNVYSNAANASFDLGLFPPGQARTVVFDKPGPVSLYCSVHKFMDGAIYVCPSSLFWRVEADGRYRIEGVPPGSYTLKTWQRRRRFPEQSVAVKVEARKPATTDVELRRK